MKQSKAFTLIELLIVMAVIAILISIAIPSFRGMQNEAKKTRATGELQTLKVAIESYYKNHSSLYPAMAGYQDTLKVAVPTILESYLYDPFVTNGSTPYNFVLSGGTPANSSYYILFSIGPSGNGSANVSATGIVSWTGDAIWESNGHLP